MNFERILSDGQFYRAAGASGALTGASANTPVFSFRWGSLVKSCIITTFNWWWFTSTAFGAAQIIDHGLWVARAFTDSDSAGNAITISGNNTKKRTQSDTTLVTDMRISSTGALTAGTRTLDTTSMAQCGAWSSAVGAALPTGAAYFNFTTGIWLATNEGICLYNLTAMGATGVIKLYIDISWTEISLNIS